MSVNCWARLTTQQMEMTSGAYTFDIAYFGVFMMLKGEKLMFKADTYLHLNIFIIYKWSIKGRRRDYNINHQTFRIMTDVNIYVYKIFSNIVYICI